MREGERGRERERERERKIKHEILCSPQLFADDDDV